VLLPAGARWAGSGVDDLQATKYSTLDWIRQAEGVAGEGHHVSESKGVGALEAPLAHLLHARQPVTCGKHHLNVAGTEFCPRRTLRSML
jgi:hypothetical protein